MASIALCCNVYNDALALRGLLEVGARYFDNIYIIHSSPGGVRSNDGTVELCESFGISPVFDDIQKGFGVIRTRLIHDCGCEWAFLLDADERFFPQMPVLDCHGNDRWVPQSNPPIRNTVTARRDIIDQGAHVKNMINRGDLMALRSTRRHWMDFTMRKPAQNWNEFPDHQLRIVRNVKEIHYKSTTLLHEHLIDDRTGADPKYAEQDNLGGPFHDHFHPFFRLAQPGHKEANENNYYRLTHGEKMVAL